MIAGLGVDVIEVERIRTAVERHGDHFLRHVFREDEQADAPDGDAKFAFYAGRWAAKEAISKVLGTGVGEACAWTDMRIHRTESGKPSAVLSGRAKKTMQALGIDAIHVTISHEKNLACAAAIAESNHAPQP